MTFQVGVVIPDGIVTFGPSRCLERTGRTTANSFKTLSAGGP